MSFGPKNQEKPRHCPQCDAALPLSTLNHCPRCGAAVRGPGDLGKAVVEAMTDVLADPLGKRKQRD